MMPFINRSLVITSPYGPRKHPITGDDQFHNGIDILAFFDPIYSPEDGECYYSGNDELSGNYVGILHKDGLITEYVHCNQINVTKGQPVKKGQQIAVTGNTGRSTAPHLHFATKFLKENARGKLVHQDPEPYAKKCWLPKTLVAIGLPLIVGTGMFLLIRST